LKAGSGTALLVYFIVSTYAFGDLMNHALVTRVGLIYSPAFKYIPPVFNENITLALTLILTLGQMPFPSFYGNRGAWVHLIYIITVTVGRRFFFLKWIAALVALLVHTQYSVMMGSAIATSLNVDFFKIKPKPVEIGLLLKPSSTSENEGAHFLVQTSSGGLEGEV